MIDAFTLINTLIYLSVLGVTAASTYFSATTYRTLKNKKAIGASKHLKTSIRELLIALVLLGLTVALMVLHELNQFGLISIGTLSFLRALSVVVLTLSMAFFVAMSFHAREGDL